MALSIPIVTVLALGACGTGSASDPQVVVTVTATAAATVAPPEISSPEPEVTGAEAIPEDEETPATIVKVPDAVGKNYQLAQDMWRAAGLVVMPATDALDLGRYAFIDENWVVVSQSPKDGTKVEAGSDITATIKKYTD